MQCAYNLNQSLYKILKDEFGLKFKFATQSLEAGIASEEQTKLLNISPNDPILILRRLTTDERDILVEFVKSLIFVFAGGSFAVDRLAEVQQWLVRVK